MKYTENLGIRARLGSSVRTCKEVVLTQCVDIQNIFLQGKE
jgi:hypothetical protein